MARVGKLPIPVPAGVKVHVSDGLVRVEGPKGKLERRVVPDVTVAVEGGTVVVKRTDDSRRGRSLHGLTQRLVGNMVAGVSKGFTRVLEINGVGYRAEARGGLRGRVRKRVRGTEARPRLSVFRSDRHTYVQVIADSAGKTLLAVSTLTPELRAQLKKTADVSAAKQVGLFAARRCLAKGIDQIVFDRNGFLYHGRVRAVAEGAREGGLKL